MNLRTKLENEILAVNLGIVVSFIFMLIWAFTDINSEKLFANYIIFYIAAIVIGFVYPIKK
jgi:putative flippase GtrA